MLMLIKRYWVCKTNTFYIIFAVLWTFIIIILSLVHLTSIPKTSIKNIDKIVHATFYFTFVVLWLLALPKLPKIKILVIALFLGGLMELLQDLMHQNRSADWYDFAANNLGAILAVLMINKIILFLRQIDLYN